MTLVLASDNKKKIAELQSILSDMDVDLITKTEAGVLEEIEETGTTFEVNAIIKAEHVAKACGLPAVSDDSGLMVDSLGGEPGVYSKRYAGEDATDEERVEYLLSKMKSVEDRRAKFVSAVSFCLPDGRSFTVMGECCGVITDKPRGEGGFGYDPIFLPDGFTETFSELSAEKKNSISHRGKALVKFKKELRSFLRDNKIEA